MKIDDERPQTPEWMLTYADMVTLLLTIFVMLVSMGELKQTDKFQGVADSLHAQFGSSSRLNLLPGELRPRNSLLASLILSGRAQREAAVGGAGERRLAIQFDPGSAELPDESAAKLRRWGARLPVTNREIEIRASMAASTDADSAFRRAHAVAQVLIAESKVDPARVRIAVTRPEGAGPDMRNMPAVPSVEIVLPGSGPR
jgi:chemotaxis protein MotB